MNSLFGLSLQVEILLKDFQSNLEFLRKENNNEIIVSFSGGKDSTLLLNLVRKHKKETDKIIINVFSENFFPEIASFIQKQRKIGEELGEKWIFINNGWDLWDVWKEYGWFGNSKFIMRMISAVQHILDNENWCGTKYTREQSLENYKRTLSNFGLKHIYDDLISGKFRTREDFVGKTSCCALIKNSKSRSNKWILTGMRAAEKNRSKIFCRDNYTRRLNILKNWTDENEKEIFKEWDIEICEIYKFLNRTGCMFCPFSGEKSFNFCKDRYYDKLSEENKAILADMEKARAYFKARK